MSSSERTSRRAFLVQLVVVVLVAAAIRLLAIVVLPVGLNTDTDGYRLIAVTLRQTGVFGVPLDDSLHKSQDSLAERVSYVDDSLRESYISHAERVKPTAYRPPLYPMLLSLLVHEGSIAPLAVGLLNVTLGAATAATVVWLGHAWKLGKWSWCAALITAFDPILVNQTTHIMTETLAAFLASVALACLTWFWREQIAGVVGGVHARLGWAYGLRGILCGSVIGLACLSRPTFLPWAVLVAGHLAWSRLNKSAQLARVLLLVLGITLVVAPWGIRNLVQFGKFKVTTTHGGYTLLLGNNRDFYEHLRKPRTSGVWRSDRLDVEWTAKRTHTNEFADDRLAYDWALSAIRAEPAMFARASALRVGRLWQLLPNRTEVTESPAIALLRYATALWYLAVYGLVVVAISRRHEVLRTTPWLWGVLLCVTFTLVHSIYWSDMRMRAPLMPFLSLVAALGASYVDERSRRAAGVSPLEIARSHE